MSEFDRITGLPKELVSFEDIAKESQTVTVSTVKKKFGKIHTVVEGINQHEVDVKDITKRLKNKFACGGTVKDGVIELQGDHTKTIKDVLVSLGFSPETIEVKEGNKKKGRR
ncbi:stress response translation initiation inhibitor YciH [Candidatus Woesearchaeota archaeon]|nr:MAG: stress response translation initiation inhibitor YciH [Candidatus Woesearchaeota archaeon]